MDINKYFFPPVRNSEFRKVKSPTSRKIESHKIIKKPLFISKNYTEEETKVQNSSSFLPSIATPGRPIKSYKLLNSYFHPVQSVVDSPHFFHKHEARPENKLKIKSENRSLNSRSGYYQMSSPSKSPFLQRRKTVVIDLDETLIHASPTASNPDHVLIKLLPDGTDICLRVLIRPYARDFLKYVSSQADTLIFTASVQSYADPIIDLLDPTNSYIKARFYRESCILTNKGFLKDLTIFQRPLSDVLIIDNLPFSFSKQKENGIQILSWYGDKSDSELLKLMKNLPKILSSEDVRKAEKNYL